MNMYQQASTTPPQTELRRCVDTFQAAAMAKLPISLEELQSDASMNLVVKNLCVDVKKLWQEENGSVCYSSLLRQAG